MDVASRTNTLVRGAPLASSQPPTSTSKIVEWLKLIIWFRDGAQRTVDTFDPQLRLLRTFSHTLLLYNYRILLQTLQGPILAKIRQHFSSWRTRSQTTCRGPWSTDKSRQWGWGWSPLHWKARESRLKALYEMTSSFHPVQLLHIKTFPIFQNRLYPNEEGNH